MYKKPENPKDYILSVLKQTKSSSHDKTHPSRTESVQIRETSGPPTENTSSKEHESSEISKDTKLSTLSPFRLVPSLSSSSEDSYTLLSQRSQPSSMRSISERSDSFHGDSFDETEFNVNQVNLLQIVTFKYHIISTLGRGSYGLVKLAKDNNTQQMRAIKIMEKQRLKRMRRLKPGQVTNALQDLLVEIAIMKKLDHRNGNLA